MAEPPRGLEALAHGTRVIGARRREQHGVAVGEPLRIETLSQHGDDAVVGTQFSGESGSPADAGQPEREARANVEAR